MFSLPQLRKDNGCRVQKLYKSYWILCTYLWIQLLQYNRSFYCDFFFHSITSEWAARNDRFWHRKCSDNYRYYWSFVTCFFFLHLSSTIRFLLLSCPSFHFLSINTMASCTHWRILLSFSTFFFCFVNLLSLPSSPYSISTILWFVWRFPNQFVTLQSDAQHHTVWLMLLHFPAKNFILHFVHCI